MKKFGVFVFILFSFAALHAQDKTVDSLKKLLTTNLHDTTRCIILNQLVENANNDDWLLHNDQLGNIAFIQLKNLPATDKLYRFYSKHLATNYFYVAYTAQEQGDKEKAIEYFKKSLKLLQEVGDKKMVVATLNNLGTMYSSLGDSTNTFRYMRAALILSYQQNNKTGILDALSNMAVVYTHYGDYANSIRCSRESIKVSERIGDKKSVATSLNNLGAVYMKQGDISMALSMYEQSLKIFEELKDDKGISYVLNNIALIYCLQGDLAKGMEYDLRALEIKRKMKDINGIAVTLNNIADLYLRLGNGEKALEFNSKSLQLNQSVANKKEIGVCYHTMAVIYKGLGKDSLAIEYGLKSLKIKEEFNDREGISYSLASLGSLYYNLKQKDKALKCLHASLNMAKEIQHVGVIRDAALQLNKVYKGEGKYKEALQYYELYTQMTDSISNAETRKAATRNQLQYEFNKKEILSKSENEKRIVNLKLETERKNTRKNSWIIALIAFSVLVLVGSFFLVNFFRQRNVIIQQKESILKQKLLVSQMNPHFIFNSLNAIQNYVFKQDSLKAGIYLSQFAELIRMILNYSRRDLISLDEEIKLLTNYIELQQLRFENKFSYTITVSEDIDTGSVQIPPMLVQPFVENAIEHGIFYKEGKGNIYVRIYRSGDTLIYEIEDDGVGLEQSMKLNSRKARGHKSLATVITQERIGITETGGNALNQIEIIDLKNVSPGLSGVRVRLRVRYKDLYQEAG